MDIFPVVQSRCPVACKGSFNEGTGDRRLLPCVQTGTLSRAEVEEKLSALAGEALVQRLQSSAWKERLEAMQTLTDLVLDQKGEPGRRHADPGKGACTPMTVLK